jgi:fumarate hydratase, class I
LDIQKFQESMYSLIVETSTNLPKDVRRAVKSAKQRENAGTRSALSLTTITNNITMADDNVSPICQDTGLPTFKIKTPVGVNQLEIKKAIRNAIILATKR